MNIKKALKIAMAQKDLNQKELFEISGVSATTISQTITGKSTPNIATVEKLAHALGLSYLELLVLGE